MEGFAVTVTMASIAGLLRSLFRPFATLRHRIWAGPETKETENKTNSIRTGTNVNWNWLRKLTRKSYLRSQCSDQFSVTQIFIEMHDSWFNTCCKFQNPQPWKTHTRLHWSCPSKDAQISEFVNTTVIYSAQGMKTNALTISKSLFFEVQWWVLVGRNKAIFPDRKANQICRVVTKLLSMPN
jgi:hypothetical protein